MDKDLLNLISEIKKSPEYRSKQREFIEKNFNLVKDKIIDEFENHPVTLEIAGGIAASNISGTLGGITNLFSFIGFDSGTDPLEPIRDLLNRSSYRIVETGGSGSSTIIFDIPTAKDIFKVTPMPWALGRSWAKGIESGISGLGYYVKQIKNSRSGLGVQSENQIRTGVSFKNTKYISNLINNFEKNLKNLDNITI
jgi:hypothetical protein